MYNLKNVEILLNKNMQLLKIDVADSLIAALSRGKKSDSSAGERTQDLLIKFRVLYQLSYWEIHASPSKQQSLSSDYKCFFVYAPDLQVDNLLTCGRRFYHQWIRLL